MALITRLSRLFKADFHAVLDQIEEPGLLLNQSIREMEDDLSRQEQHGRRLVHEQEQLAARRDELQNSVDRLDEELDVCFAAEKDDLARVLIKRKLQAQRLLGQLDSNVQALTKSYSEHAGCMEQNRTTLESMRQKAGLFATKAEATRGPHGVGDNDFMPCGVSIEEHDVEIAFLREKGRRDAS